MADNVNLDICCPACGKTMKKVFMKEQRMFLDVCVDGCGGIYFDNREFKKIDENAEDISPLMEVLSNKNFKEVDTTQDRFCPNCGMKMVKNFSSARKTIEIDECYGCGGKFLDFSELDKFRQEYETEEARVEGVLADLYSTVGIEIEANDEAYEKRMKRSSLFSKFMKMKYGD